MASEHTDRDEGVDFTEINDVLEDLSYPISKDEFVEDHGDRTIERTNAEPIAVRELFEGTGGDEFEDPEGVRQAILNLMPRESVGRQRYSDRAGATPDEGRSGEKDDQSL